MYYAAWLLAFFTVTEVYDFTNSATIRERLIDAKTAIKYVNDVIQNGSCTGGTENTLKLQFDHKRWDSFARIAVKTANFLSKVIQRNDGILSGFDENFLYSMVRNNIQGDDLVFGSAIAFEEYVYPGRRIFCPYAFMDDGTMATAFDLGLGYDYLEPDVEWYAAIRQRDYSNITVARDRVFLGNQSVIEETFFEPMSSLTDGRWTYPYFDCGGGDIWMVTYSSPILGLNSTLTPPQVVLRGVATIDIELTNIDVNQCDLTSNSKVSDSSGSLDVFRGTHSCQPTTKCKALIGYGFRRGSYLCECETGFYFPNPLSLTKAFNGSIIEAYYDSHNTTGHVELFQCIRCARGCDSCVDASPCMITFNMIIRLSLLLLSVILMGGICVTSFLTHKFKAEKVIKSASPIFLQITLLGSALMNSQMFLLFPEPNDIVCMISPWFTYTGFAMAYGALLLKTWRISTIFRYGTTKRVNLPDKVLLQWLLPIVGSASIFLVAWTVVSPPVSQIIVTESLLKYVHCTTDYWLYAAKSGEVVLLLWGVYLSFTVRKAPSQFNESKFISWSIYNAILLGTFMVVIIQFIALPQGPDMVYALTFLYIQIRVTMTLGLFFAPKVIASNLWTGFFVLNIHSFQPKFYSLYRLAKHPELAEAEEANGRGMYRTTIATVATISSSKIRQHASNQTIYSWLDTEKPIKIDRESEIINNLSNKSFPSNGLDILTQERPSASLKRNQIAPKEDGHLAVTTEKSSSLESPT